MIDGTTGADARRAGLPRSANPHRLGTDAHDLWDISWLFAETESAANLPKDEEAPCPE
ncbi:hypothetical protein [Azospirillum sp.]|uniref:hypothetical protein n=1 Tax=Azospirillum sp. TaxID=34012 RepID=UPI003D70AF9C